MAGRTVVAKQHLAGAFYILGQITVGKDGRRCQIFEPGFILAAHRINFTLVGLHFLDRRPSPESFEEGVGGWNGNGRVVQPIYQHPDRTGRQTQHPPPGWLIGKVSQVVVPQVPGSSYTPIGILIGVSAATLGALLVLFASLPFPITRRILIFTHFLSPELISSSSSSAMPRQDSNLSLFAVRNTMK